ncbi:hypothetical protein HNR39_001292 [Glaciimonas immobilis]|uniref:Potassium ABC transporter ATPase n=1 Tax=Glaciimonas immobilis TaxID=728004 RepID=A0A840RP24_9BURK|nr:hypothetical protein [Glaciimonas immobilis]
MNLLMDGLFIAAIMVFFGVTWALAVGCKKLEDRK